MSSTIYMNISVHKKNPIKKERGKTSMRGKMSMG
jgi:hypothetical protein